MKHHEWIDCVWMLIGLMLLSSPGNAAPMIMNYQGLVEVDGAPFSGTGLFRFAIVNDTGAVQYWSSDGAEPPGSDIPLTVTNGLFKVMLGEIPVMNPLDLSVFENEPLYLRIWFDDQVNGIQLLTPDRPLLSTGFAIKASDSDYLEGQSGAYYLDWNNLSDIPPEIADGLDDDQPDDDAEVPDTISINNGGLYAMAGSGNVGIGTTSPDEKLHVAGNIQSTGSITASGDIVTESDFTFSPTRTFYRQIPGSAFQPAQDSTDDVWKIAYTKGCISAGTAPYNIDLYAPIVLPENARITNVDFFYIDNSGSYDLEATLKMIVYNLELSVGYTVIDENVVSSSSSTDIQTESFAGLATINNYANQYVISVNWTVDGVGCELSFVGCRITYETTSLNP